MTTHPAPPARQIAWPYWPLVPLYPYGKRRTLRTEVLKDTIWTFEQLQGILYVIVPVRMTVIRLAAGGLFVYAPVAPTRECRQLLQELIDRHGPVKFIIQPTASGIEHKAFIGPFARQHPEAQIYVVPGQWSFPLNLPLSWLGLPAQRTQLLPPDPSQTPFADELDYDCLGPVELGPGPFAEVAFFHKATRTLLLADLLVSVPDHPPAILQLDPYPLLYHARDHVFDRVADTPEVRRKGWHRIALFAFFFRPSALTVTGWRQSFQEASQAQDRSKKAFFGLFPVQWHPNWTESFAALRGGGRPFVAPILQQLVLNRGSATVLSWANRVATWEFQQMIPCHFDAPVPVTATQFRQAFQFLEAHPTPSTETVALPPTDFKFLLAFDHMLVKQGITPPPQDKV